MATGLALSQPPFFRGSSFWGHKSDNIGSILANASN